MTAVFLSLLLSMDPSVCYQLRAADSMKDDKYGCLQLTDCKMYFNMVLKITFKYDLHRKHGNGPVDIR